MPGAGKRMNRRLAAAALSPRSARRSAPPPLPANVCFCPPLQVLPWLLRLAFGQPELRWRLGAALILLLGWVPSSRAAPCATLWKRSQRAALAFRTVLLWAPAATAVRARCPAICQPGLTNRVCRQEPIHLHSSALTVSGQTSLAHLPPPPPPLTPPQVQGGGPVGSLLLQAGCGCASGRQRRQRRAARRCAGAAAVGRLPRGGWPRQGAAGAGVCARVAGERGRSAEPGLVIVALLAWRFDMAAAGQTAALVWAHPCGSGAAGHRAGLAIPTLPRIVV